MTGVQTCALPICSGLAAKEDLANFFEEHNLNYEYFGNLYNSDCKDVNELLVNNML